MKWNDHNGIVEAMDSSKVLINFAGRSVDCRVIPEWLEREGCSFACEYIDKVLQDILRSPPEFRRT